MRWIFRNFLKGCLVLVPVAVTAYVVWRLIAWVASLFPEDLGPVGISIGVGVAGVVIVLVGWLGSNVVGRSVLGFFDRLIVRVPVVKLVYTFVRDLLQALFGESRSFDRPVVVALGEGASASRVFGFMTREDLSEFGVEDLVAVYLPQSLNFAGNLVLVPRARVQHLDTDQGRLLSFVASAGMMKGGGTAGPVSEPAEGQAASRPDA